MAADTNNERDVAREVYARSSEMDSRGHLTYCRHARRNDDYYLGGGLQWRPEHRLEIEASGRPCHEINDIMPQVNAAGGYQIANRMDIAYLPRGQGTDEQVAKAFSKFAKTALDNTSYRDRETELFLDGLIQQRGYIDVRMDYQTNMKGEIKAVNLDPMDVKPDPDGTDYDPDTWSDVIKGRWLTLMQIEGLWGTDAAAFVQAHAAVCGREGRTGKYMEIRDTPRSQFGTDDGYWADAPYYGIGRTYRLQDGLMLYYIIERQSFEMRQALCGLYPTGDIRVFEGLSREQIAFAISSGVFVAKRRVRQVRWQTCLPDACIFNKIVPYEHFSIIPYFPYFRRGRTRGLVDNAISPQDLTNKFVSQAAHVVNSIANSGWQAEDGQLVTPTQKQLEKKGHQTGLIIVRKKGTAPLEKITPNEMPEGLREMIELGQQGVHRATGINESLLGADGNSDMSGVAIQSRQFAAQQQLAIPLWRLSQTRRMLAVRVQKMIQRFMIDERTVRIVESDEYGIEQHKQLTVNRVLPDGGIYNDLTSGEYDIAITEQPMQVTFDNSQFEQLKQMRELGVAIPDSVMLRYSSLPDKEEVANAIKAQAEAQAGAASDPTIEAKANKDNAGAELARAQSDFVKSETVNQLTTAMFSAGRVAQMIAADPSVADLADELYKSAGGIDANGPPLAGPIAPGTASPPPPTSTNPLTPDHPDVGANAGIETLSPSGAQPNPSESTQP
ncbi:MAG TPA: hypothetical protein VLE97_01925 [Gaiellaceae bacterium]|nr:hypothetical protein [Gaiellaceae bacterium]